MICGEPHSLLPLDVSDTDYLQDLFIAYPPCEFKDGCCPGSGCCFKCGATQFTENYQTMLSTYLKASFVASVMAYKEADLAALDDMTFDE